MRLTNNHGIPLGLAVWIAHDNYDYDGRPNYISVTSLIRPVRQLILGQRAARMPGASVDVMDLLSSARGQAFHDAIERAWVHHYKDAMKRLGYPDRVIDMVRINPETPEPNTLPVYLEQRAEVEIDGFIIGGKYDMVIEGELTDNKSTSTYTYVKKTGDSKWQLQGSIYRLINKQKVTSDYFNIQYVFVDWKRSLVATTAGYPATPVLAERIPLLSLNETEAYVRAKIAELKVLWDAPESQLPLCTDEDLWRDPPVYKYYGKMDAKRASKVFDNASDANAMLASKGTGYVKEFPGKATACDYCAGRALCSQFVNMNKAENP